MFFIVRELALSLIGFLIASPFVAFFIYYGRDLATPEDMGSKN